MDDTLEYEYMIEFFNECLEDLSEVAGFEKTKTFTITKGNSVIALPDDFIQINEITFMKDDEKVIIEKDNNRKEDIDKPTYKRYMNEIEIEPSQDRTITIRYDALLTPLDYPKEFTDGELNPSFYNQTPALRQNFHKALPLYVAIKYSQNWKDSLQEKRDFEQEYERIRVLLFQDTQKRKGTTKPMRVVNRKPMF